MSCAAVSRWRSWTAVVLILALFGAACGGGSGARDAASGGRGSGEAAPLAVQDHEAGGVDVALLEVRRAGGDTLTVRWRYRNTSDQDKLLAEGSGDRHDAYLITGEAYLLDPVNKKKYLVIRDADDNPVASKHGSGTVTMLAAGQTMSAWAKFPAPPPDVATISVYIPSVAPFEGVGIR